MQDLIYYANEKIKEGLERAEKHFGRSFSFPKVEFNLRGRAAGRANYLENEIRLNSHIFRENEDEFISRTIPHELAHLLSFQVFGIEGTGHKEKWRFVCKVLGMNDLQRCHSYKNVKSAWTRKKLSRFAFACDCGVPHNLTSVRVKRIRQGSVYRCSHCKSRLRPI